MSRTHFLGFAFLAPALLVAALFFLLPVLLTVVFSFTNMSTATGIMGGDYMLTETQLRRADDTDISPETIARLTGAGYAINETTLTRFGADYGGARADALRTDHMGATFDARRDLEKLLKTLRVDPMRNTRERKAAAELFAVSLLGERFTSADAFTAQLTTMGIPTADQAALTTLAYTGWTFTTQNFELLFQLPSTLRYALNTLIYVVFTLAFNVGFGLFLAISTFYLPSGPAAVFRTIWFLPRILPPVLYVLMWNWFTWDGGFLSQVMQVFGFPEQNWMMQTRTHAWVVVILINGFIGASLGMILFSSAIKAIPETLLFASAVDGAGRWQQVRHIILPLLRWPILFITSYQTLSLLTSFEYILLATDGGPGRATEVWSLAAYHTALNNYGGNLEYGFGAAYALVLVVIGIALSLVYLRFFNFKELVATPRIEQ